MHAHGQVGSATFGQLTATSPWIWQHTVEYKYISPSSTVRIQLHVSAQYVGHLQAVI